MAKRLKTKYLELFSDWESYHERYGCSCHINPPCGSCTHEGHPLALEDNSEAWVENEDKDEGPLGG